MLLWTGESAMLCRFWFYSLGRQEARSLSRAERGPKFLALAVYESPKFVYTYRSLPTRCVWSIEDRASVGFLDELSFVVLEIFARLSAIFPLSKDSCSLFNWEPNGFLWKQTRFLGEETSYLRFWVYSKRNYKSKSNRKICSTDQAFWTSLIK